MPAIFRGPLCALGQFEKTYNSIEISLSSSFFRYRQTTATLDVRGFEFRAAGRQPIDLGWRAAFPEWQPADEKGDEAQLLPPLRNGETAQLQDPKIEGKENSATAALQ